MLTENQINKFINIYQLAKTFLDAIETEHCCATMDYSIEKCPICLQPVCRVCLYPNPLDGEYMAFFCTECKASGTVVEFIERVRRLTKQEAVQFINELIDRE